MARPEAEIAELRKKLASRDSQFSSLVDAHKQLKDQIAEMADRMAGAEADLKTSQSNLHRANNDLVTREYLLGVALNALKPFADAAEDYDDRRNINPGTCILNPVLHGAQSTHIRIQHLNNAARALEIFKNNLQPEDRKEEKHMKAFILSLLSAILTLQKSSNQDQTALKKLQDQVGELTNRTDVLNDPAIRDQLNAVLQNAASQPPETATASAPPVGTAGEIQAPPPEQQQSGEGAEAAETGDQQQTGENQQQTGEQSGSSQ